ncbi:MAG TPA: SAM-dependent methyltransferase [Usitatibacter sp.]|nr:SAM-dependent methyltransferase [Usitatibacter sp.]
MTASGRLYLVPAWLSEDTPPADTVPAAVLARMRLLERFVVEDARSARRYLAACAHPKPMRELALEELNEHTADDAIPALLKPLLAGTDTGLLSEAGVPAVADPGAKLVAAAHANGVAVVPMVGPSSILLALMASGLDGQRFRFVGYLPAAAAARKDAITELERQSARHRETQVFIETPYRNDAMLQELLATCRPQTRLAIAAELTGPGEWIRSAPISRWQRDVPKIGKRPAIFLLLA